MSNEFVDNVHYKNLFIDNQTGARVLEELTALFYDRPSYKEGDSYHTAYLEGQRAVMDFILRKTILQKIEEE